MRITGGGGQNATRPNLCNLIKGRLERAAGIEPASLAWKAKVLPLHNARATGYPPISKEKRGQAYPCLLLKFKPVLFALARLITHWPIL